MVGPSTWSRLRRTSWPDRRRLAEACATVTFASAAIAFLPFRRLAAWLNGYRPDRPVDTAQRRQEIVRCSWAVAAAARRLPWRTVCFQQGLALHLMLRRRGIATQLHYGIAQQADGLAAHVWVSDQGETIIGGDAADGFTIVASFPDGDPSARGAVLGR